MADESLYPVSKSDVKKLLKKKKEKGSFNKANLKMIKELSKDSYPISESDVKKLTD